MVDEVEEVPSQPIRTDRRREFIRIQRDLRKRRFAFALIGVFMLVILGILLAGYVVIFVRPPQQLVVRVNEVRYSRGDMVKLLRVRQKSLETTGQKLDLSTDIFEALQLLVENEIIAQSAPALGITTSDSEIDFSIRAQLDPEGAAAGTSDAQRDRDYKERYGSFLNLTRISEEEHRQIVRRAILRERMRQFIGDSVPSVAEQAHVYRFAVVPNDEIDIILTKYKDMTQGSTDPALLSLAFDRITGEFSRESRESVRRGGDIGWVPAGIISEYDDIIFGSSYSDPLEIGKLSDPVRNQGDAQQLFIFMVTERDPARELSLASRDELKTRALANWLNDQRADYDVYAVMNSDIYNWVIQQLGISSTITPTPAPASPLQQIRGF
ncbi:MAG: SurA N-terminal domain-containing protein [Chloroflexi bacterium]|nr:SurA N-terminal domain-containing protein [Chloroflexota bacterium]